MAFGPPGNAVPGRFLRANRAGVARSRPLVLFLFALTTRRQIYIVRAGKPSYFKRGWTFALPSALSQVWGLPGLRCFWLKTAPRSIRYHEVSIGTHFVRFGIAERLLGMEPDGETNPGG